MSLLRCDVAGGEVIFKAASETNGFIGRLPGTRVRFCRANDSATGKRYSVRYPIERMLPKPIQCAGLRDNVQSRAVGQTVP